MTKILTLVSLFLLSILTACDSGIGQQKTTNLASDSTTQVIAPSMKIDDRFSIVGDFNGDKVQDTIFESYISSLTNTECPKNRDSVDYDKNVELIMNQKPVTRLYSGLKDIDTFIVTTGRQQIGIYLFSNLGDINDDGSDEFGYIIDWADYSNLNTFHVMTLRGKQIKELMSFKINESVSLDPDNLIDGKLLIKPTGPKTIEYKFYSDSATVETDTHTFN